MFITEEDFEMMSSNKMQWAGYDWEVQAARFDNQEISFQFQWGYWFETRTALILARNFLMQRELPFHESYDAGMESFVIVTDYALEPVYF